MIIFDTLLKNMEDNRREFIKAAAVVIPILVVPALAVNAYEKATEYEEIDLIDLSSISPDKYDGRRISTKGFIGGDGLTISLVDKAPWNSFDQIEKRYQLFVNQSDSRPIGAHDDNTQSLARGKYIYIGIRADSRGNTINPHLESMLALSDIVGRGAIIRGTWHNTTDANGDTGSGFYTPFLEIEDIQFVSKTAFIENRRSIMKHIKRLF